MLYKISHKPNIAIPNYVSDKAHVAQWISYVGAKFNTKNLWLLGFDLDIPTDSIGQAWYRKQVEIVYISKIKNWDIGHGIAVTNDGTTLNTNNPWPYMDENGNFSYLNNIS